MTDAPDDWVPTRLDRLLACHRYVAWAVTSLMVVQFRLYLAYDWAMLRFWPYDRYPDEWRGLFKRKGRP